MKLSRASKVFAVLSIGAGILLFIFSFAGLNRTQKNFLSVQADNKKLSDKIEQFNYASEALGDICSSDKLKEELDALISEHEAHISEHKTALAIYTATESGLNSGKEALDEAGWVVRMAIDKYNSGKAEFDSMLAAYGMTERDIPSDADVAAMAGQVQQLRSKVSEMQSQIDSIESMVTANDSLKALKQEMDSLELQLSELREDYSNSKALYDSLDKGSTDAETLENLNAELETKQNAIAIAETSVEATAMQIAMIEASLPDEQTINMAVNSLPFLYSTVSQLKDGLTQAENGLTMMMSIVQAKKTMDEAWIALKEAKLQIDIGINELSSKYDEIYAQSKDLAAEKDQLEKEAVEIEEKQENLNNVENFEELAATAERWLLRDSEIGSEVENGGELLEVSVNILQKRIQNAESIKTDLLVFYISAICISVIAVVAAVLTMKDHGVRLFNIFVLVAETLLAVFGVVKCNASYFVSALPLISFFENLSLIQRK